MRRFRLKKIKLILEPDRSCPPRTRPETHFIKFSDKDWELMNDAAAKGGQTLEEFLLEAIQSGLEKLAQKGTNSQG